MLSTASCYPLKSVHCIYLYGRWIPWTFQYAISFQSIPFLLARVSIHSLVCPVIGRSRSYRCLHRYNESLYVFSLLCSLNHTHANQYLPHRISATSWPRGVNGPSAAGWVVIGWWGSYRRLYLHNEVVFGFVLLCQSDLKDALSVPQR